MAMTTAVALACACATRLPPTASPSPAPTPTTTPTAGRGTRREVRIGVVYPLSGRLGEWGKQALPFMRLAESDLNASPEAAAAGVRFRCVVRSSDTSGEGALAAAQELVEKEGVCALAGLPLSQELAAVMPYLAQQRVMAISSASTSPAPELRQPDSVFRIAPPELYLARTLARLALHLGYRKAAIIHRSDDWGQRYAAEIAAAFGEAGHPVALVPIEPTHPQVGDYAPEVAQLSQQVAALGADDQTVVFLVVWEGEDLEILHHAAQDAGLSRVRWLAAVLYPSLLTGRFGALDLPDARDFALAHGLWGQESHPARNALLTRLWNEATAELGQPPSFEHVYLYDALEIAGRAVLRAGGATDGNALSAFIPAVAEGYAPATGSMRFDEDGDRAWADLAYYGLFRATERFEYRHFAYYYAVPDRFELLPEPVLRPVQFCPEC